MGLSRLLVVEDNIIDVTAWSEELNLLVVTAATGGANGCWELQFDSVSSVSSVSGCGLDVTSCVSGKEDFWLLMLMLLLLSLLLLPLLLLVYFHLDCSFPVFHLLTGFCSWRCARGFPLCHLETLWLHRSSFITTPAPLQKTLQRSLWKDIFSCQSFFLIFYYYIVIHFFFSE